jgi:DNA-binding transcriptional ArsR family regulator
VLLFVAKLRQSHKGVTAKQISEAMISVGEAKREESAISMALGRLAVLGLVTIDRQQGSRATSRGSSETTTVRLAVEPTEIEELVSAMCQANRCATKTRMLLTGVTSL